MVTGEKAYRRDIFHDEGGFSTMGVVLALLITLSLIFTAAQVYQISAASADVQEVADASALAAENVVAEFYIVARVCDAVVLSLSLTGLVVTGLGVAALCTPVTASLSPTLLKHGAEVLEARERFAAKAARGLNSLQRSLPFIAAAQSAAVVAENKGRSGTGYFGFAVLMPSEGKEISVSALDVGELERAIDDHEDEIRQAGEEAEKVAKEANAAKEKGFHYDCGNNPDYCLYERAAKLANLAPADNPLYQSVDAWSFSAALKRAQAYYPARLASEMPPGNSVAEQANSALRKTFYEYACRKLAEGYVIDEDAGVFRAYFPLLPKNNAEMRETELYNQSIYFVTDDGSARTVHAWSGCPNAQGAGGTISLADMENGEYATCPACEFTVSSMGEVAAASSSIENGFEYSYRQVAEAAAEYQKGRENYEPQAGKVKSLASDLFKIIGDYLEKTAGSRIEVAPPGRYGAVALVGSTGGMPASTGFASRFVGDGGTLGTRAALSAAVLVSDKPEQGKTVIASILDGVKEEGDSLGIGTLDSVLDVWSAMLMAYADGQSAVEKGLDKLTSHIPFASASGLEKWASSAFASFVKKLGLRPAGMDVPKPVIVNSGHVLAADSSAFSSHLLEVKRRAESLSGNDVFSSAVNALERSAIKSIEGFDGRVTIASIEFAGKGGPSIPITIALPESVRDSSIDIVSSLADRLRDIAGSVTGRRQWQ